MSSLTSAATGSEELNRSFDNWELKETLQVKYNSWKQERARTTGHRRPR